MTVMFDDLHTCMRAAVTRWSSTLTTPSEAALALADEISLMPDATWGDEESEEAQGTVNLVRV